MFDIGVSSMQLDEAERGFSLRFDAPLDMRMGESGRTAADILGEEDEATVADILYHFGEERAARRIARAIVADRAAAPFISTLQLAHMIARVAPARPGELTHPATRTFQALRIAVNDELGELLRGLAAAERLLKPGGRLAVVSFHSLEDRIAKQFLVRARTGDAPRRGYSRASRPKPSRPSTFRADNRSSRARRSPRPIRVRARRNCGSRRGSRLRALPPDDMIAALTRLPARRRRQPMIWRLMHAFAILGLIGSAAYVYGVKYRTIYASEQLVKTRHLIAKEKDAINLLRAEYAHLARPDRLQALADAKLGIQPL